MLFGIQYCDCPALLKSIQVQETLVFFNVKGYGKLFSGSVLCPQSQSKKVLNFGNFCKETPMPRWDEKISRLQGVELHIGVVFVGTLVKSWEVAFIHGVQRGIA
jgi:hypothetical protein